MSRSLIIACSTLLAGSLGVVAAQHPGAASHHPLQMLHSLCDNSPANQASKAHVPEHFAKMLNLSTTQLDEIEKLANEACAVMKRTHEGILQVLTPEQRAKVRELHGGD